MQLTAFPLVNRSETRTFRERLDHFCEAGWADLTNSLEGRCCHRLAQVIKRILLFIPLIIATVVQFFCRLSDKLLLKETPNNSQNQQPFQIPARLSLHEKLGWSCGERSTLTTLVNWKSIQTEESIRKIHEFYAIRATIPNKPHYFAVDAVHSACRYGNLPVLQALLEHEPNNLILQTKTFGFKHNSLHEVLNSYYSQGKSCLKFLLQNNVDVEARDRDGRTPLIILSKKLGWESKLSGLKILLTHVSKLHKGKIQQIMLELTAQAIPKDLICLINSFLSQYECPDYVNISAQDGSTPLFYLNMKYFGIQTEEKNKASKEEIASTHLLLDAGASPFARASISIPGEKDPDMPETPAQFIRRTKSNHPTNEKIINLLETAAADESNKQLQVFYQARWAITIKGDPDKRYYSPEVEITED